MEASAREVFRDLVKAEREASDQSEFVAVEMPDEPNLDPEQMAWLVVTVAAWMTWRDHEALALRLRKDVTPGFVDPHLWNRMCMLRAQGMRREGAERSAARYERLRFEDDHPAMNDSWRQH
jgi:hypothetical protein